MRNPWTNIFKDIQNDKIEFENYIHYDSHNCSVIIKLFNKAYKEFCKNNNAKDIEFLKDIFSEPEKVRSYLSKRDFKTFLKMTHSADYYKYIMEKEVKYKVYNSEKKCTRDEKIDAFNYYLQKWYHFCNVYGYIMIGILGSFTIPMFICGVIEATQFTEGFWDVIQRFGAGMILGIFAGAFACPVLAPACIIYAFILRPRLLRLLFSIEPLGIVVYDEDEYFNRATVSSLLVGFIGGRHIAKYK